MTLNIATRHPYRFTALLVLVILTANLIASAVASTFSLDTSNTSGAFFVANLVLAIFVATLLMRLRWWRHIGFRPLATLRDLRLYWFPFTLVLVNLSFSGPELSIGRVTYFLALAGLIGFVEEGIFRGLMLRTLAPQGLWSAVIISSTLFGLLHLLNAILGTDFLVALLQVGYALAIGFGFAAVTLRTQVLWPLVVIHALIDFTSFLATDGASSESVTTVDVLVTALYIVGFTGFGIFLMRSATGTESPIR